MGNWEVSEERDGMWNNTGEEPKASEGQRIRKSLPISPNLKPFILGHSWVIHSKRFSLPIKKQATFSIPDFGA